MPLSNAFFFSFSGSLRHGRCMGNYISILYHNSVISTKNSENWVTFCASLQSLNCNFNMQYANERPKQFPINGRREDCIPLMRINWLIAQRYQILPFYGRFLPGFNLCKFWAKICASRKTVKTLIWFWQPIAYSPMACDLKPQENSWSVMQAWSSGILFKQLLCLTFIILLLPLSWNFYEYKKLLISVYEREEEFQFFYI